jgi:peptidyl-prolyl cis-trans isomerase B (cyclophilin B)
MVELRWHLGAWLALAMILPLAGCGGSSESTEPEVTASIDGGQPAAEAAPLPYGAVPERIHPRVKLETSLGPITVELDPDKAPLTVENFLSYVENGHYDQTIFHQVVEGYMILGGGFTAQMSEKPVMTPIRNEAHNGVSNRRGTIAMARQFDAIDSSTSQFFINLADNTALDHKSRTAEEYGYCVFGQVVEGMDVVDRISKVQVTSASGFEMTPTQAVTIKSATRLR